MIFFHFCLSFWLFIHHHHPRRWQGWHNAEAPLHMFAVCIKPTELLKFILSLVFFLVSHITTSKIFSHFLRKWKEKYEKCLLFIYYLMQRDSTCVMLIQLVKILSFVLLFKWIVQCQHARQYFMWEKDF